MNPLFKSILIILIVLPVWGCDNKSFSGSYVEVTLSSKDHPGNCDRPIGGCIVIYTWYHDDIINAIYRNPLTVSEDTIKSDSIYSVQLIQKLNRHVK